MSVFPMPSRPTYLIVKPPYLTLSQQFSRTPMFCLGQRHLDAAIGYRSFTEEYVSKKVKLYMV